VVLPEGTAVLNASNPLVAAMASLCDGAVIFFALDASQPVITQHRDQGGRAVFVRDAQVVLAEGQDETVLTSLSAIAFTEGGQLAFQVENVLAAVGAAWALGIGLDMIRAGIEIFGAEPPGTSPEGAAPALESAI